MKLNYKKVKTFLDENFSSYQDEEGTKKYYNKENKIVGAGNNKVLTIFYTEEQTNTIYAVSIIKKIYIGNEGNQKVIDAMYIQPINELYKGTTVENNFAIKAHYNKEEGISDKIEPIGTVARGNNGKRIFKNKDFIIEVPRREYVIRDFFNCGEVCLLVLETHYATNKINYNEVFNYYKNTYKCLDSDNTFPGKETIGSYVKKRQCTTYDKLGYPTIKRT